MIENNLSKTADFDWIDLMRKKCQINLRNSKANGMNTSENNQFDAIENLIFQYGIRIQALDIKPELDLMTIYLNTRAILSQHISSYRLLRNAGKSQLLQYELVGGGTGVHWPLLDEDLSLKGFLHDELKELLRVMEIR